MKLRHVMIPVDGLVGRVRPRSAPTEIARLPGSRGRVCSFCNGPLGASAVAVFRSSEVYHFAACDTCIGRMAEEAGLL